MVRSGNIVRALRSAAAFSSVFIVIFFIAKTLGRAQEQSHTSPPTSTSIGIKPEPASASEPATAGGEDSGDKTAQLKYSASVRWMARKLGVSVFTAYGLSVALNFITIISVAVVFLRSKLPGWFHSRTEVIRQSLDEARKTSAEAQQRLSAIETRIAKLQSEIAGMESAADREWQVEEQRIRATTDEEKHKIVEAAEQEIAAAVNLARRDFKAYAANLAVTLAASRIQVDAATDEGLVMSFIEKLGENGSN
jgi:F-type H+-transporting ATPase subunit b